METTNKSVDANGYHYVETSDAWKNVCLALPCFAALTWPDYSTRVLEDVIDGKPVVIQLWKGWCQKIFGNNDLPGGIGAEVGIYQRVPGKVPPADLSFLHSQAMEFLINGVARLGGDNLWWPYPELKTTVDWELVNPKTGETFIKAGPEQTYWMNKWMNPDSYEEYKKVHRTPLFSAQYKLKYRINGKTYEW